MMKEEGRPLMYSLEDMAKINNKGAKFLEMHDVESAHELFRGAITKLVGEGGTNFIDSTSEGDLEQESRLIKSGAAGSASVEDPTIVYTFAIHVPHKANLVLDCPRNNASLLIACSIFNLGLVYHIRGMFSRGNLQRQLYLKAFSLYNKSACLVFDGGIGCHVTKHPVLDLLSMAVLNNLCHITHDLGQFERTRSCMEGLLRVASAVQPFRYMNDDVAEILCQAKETFCLNTYVFQPPSAASAA